MAGCEILNHERVRCTRGYAHDEPCDFGEPPRPLTRDMLLAEVRRSLMATHPERAEALCAALERLVPAVMDFGGLFVHRSEEGLTSDKLMALVYRIETAAIELPAATLLPMRRDEFDRIVRRVNGPYPTLHPSIPDPEGD